MVSSRYGARLSQTDVVDLNSASEQLAAAAHTIRRANPAWAEAVVNNLVAANNVIVRLQNKGAAAFARYLERRGLKPPAEGEIAAEPSDQVADAPKTPQNESED